jgi:hypothetical protein
MTVAANAFRAWAFIVRSIYLSAMAFAPALALFWLVGTVAPWEVTARELPSYVVFVALSVLLYFVLPARAWLRILRRDPLIPDDLLRARPLSAFFVLVLAGLGALLFFTFLRLKTGPAIEDFEGNSGFTALMALMTYALALPVGEFLLMRRVAAAPR